MEKYELSETRLPTRKKSDSRKPLLVGIIAALAVGIGIGILIGHFAIKSAADDKPVNVPVMDSTTGGPQIHQFDALIQDENPDIGKILINNISSENIRENLRYLSSLPHLAGTERNHILAKNLTTFWTEHGLDHVALTPYEVLLSYPNMSNLNYVELLDENGTEIYKSYLTEPILTPEENKTGVVPPFNAYSAPGDVQGELVYLNYGRVEDYITFQNNTSINITGKIVLVRYGKIFRGDKDIDLVRGVHPVERPARADRDTDRAERGRCFDTHEQVFLLDEHRGQGRYPAYTPNSNIDSQCIQNGVAEQIEHIYQVHLAEMHGAKGIIIFSDPSDYAGGDPEQVYPRDWWLPPSGTQRGTVFTGDGDPLTPGYPSIATAYRQLVNETEFYMPKIPSHPIGYGIAVKLMEQMAGDEVPIKWRGGMNTTYRFGGSFKTAGWKAHIMVSTQNQKATIYNAFGIIKGSVEPDRYVLIGNHRDAWVFGAIDPSSGTAVMMEISRVMGAIVKSGTWRPRRTIIFCSWGAEEYGLVGSTEWVEQYIKPLGSRTVAYLNVDCAVIGNYSFHASGTPMMYESLYSATQKVPNPNDTEISAGRKTVYDTWLKYFPSNSGDRPEVELPGSGTDHAPFRDRMGVPISDIFYTFSQDLLDYPLYHSMYETFLAVDQIMDKGFKYHQAVGRVWGEMARHLADSLILPFNVSDYVVLMRSMATSLLKGYGAKMDRNGIDTGQLTDVIDNFTAEVESFENAVKNVDKNNPYAIRLINDQLMQLDRAFLDPAGLPGRNLKKNILLAESSVDSYSGSSFPGLVDSMFEIDKDPDQVSRWKVVKKHFSVILFTIQSAASSLKDVSDFMYHYSH